MKALKPRKSKSHSVKESSYENQNMINLADIYTKMFLSRKRTNVNWKGRLKCSYPGNERVFLLQYVDMNSCWLSQERDFIFYNSWCSRNSLQNRTHKSSRYIHRTIALNSDTNIFAITFTKLPWARLRVPQNINDSLDEFSKRSPAPTQISFN
jgi:hypothetical protein